MKKSSMQPMRAVARGLHFGAIVGMGVALVTGLGLLGAPMMGIAGIAGLALTNTLVGAAAGGFLFGTTHVITHSVPGVSQVTGEAPRELATPAEGRKKGRNRAPVYHEVEEEDDRNIGIRRQLEEQMRRDEERQEAGGISR